MEPVASRDPQPAFIQDFDRLGPAEPILVAGRHGVCFSARDSHMMTSSDTMAPLRFDLARGRIHNREGDNFVLLPISVMSELCRSLPEDSLVSLGYAVGTEIGRRLSQRVNGSSSLSVGDIVTEIGIELATAGFGTLGVEIWGKALVFTLEASPLTFGGSNGIDRADPLIGAVLSGILMRAFSRDGNVVAIGRTAGIARFVACSLGTSERVEQWLNEDLTATEVLARLNQGGAA